MRRVVALSVLLLVVATGIATIAAPTAADATSPVTGPSDQTDISTVTAVGNGTETTNATAAGNGTVIVKYRMAGTTATGVSVDDPRTARKRVAAELGVPADRVAIVGQSGSTSVEVRSPDVTPAGTGDRAVGGERQRRPRERLDGRGR